MFRPLLLVIPSSFRGLNIIHTDVPKMTYSVQTSSLNSKYTTCLLNNWTGSLTDISNLCPKSNSWPPFPVFFFLYFKRHVSFQLLKSKTFYNQFPIHWQIMLGTMKSKLVFYTSLSLLPLLPEVNSSHGSQSIPFKT